MVLKLSHIKHLCVWAPNLMINSCKHKHVYKNKQVNIQVWISEVKLYNYIYRPSNAVYKKCANAERAQRKKSFASAIIKKKCSSKANGAKIILLFGHTRWSVSLDLIPCLRQNNVK